MDNLTRAIHLLSEDPEFVAWFSSAKTIELANALREAYSNHTYQTKREVAEITMLANGLMRDSSHNMQNNSNTGSSIRGIQGEQQVETILQESFRVVPTAKDGKRGDFLVSRINGIHADASHGAVLVEIKNYSGTVPRAEVTKFHKDIESAVCTAGLFVSLYSRVVGVPKRFQLDWYTTPTRGRCPIIYLVEPTTEILTISTDLLLSIAESRTLAITDELAAHIHAASEAVSSLSEIARFVHETRTTLDRSLARAETEISKTEAVARSHLQFVVKAMNEKIGTAITDGTAIAREAPEVEMIEANPKKGKRAAKQKPEIVEVVMADAPVIKEESRPKRNRRRAD